MPVSSQVHMDGMFHSSLLLMRYLVFMYSTSSAPEVIKRFYNALLDQTNCVDFWQHLVIAVKLYSTLV